MGATVFRWDLDKTYLVSDFESLRSLLRVPFERAEDKVAIPGVVALIRGLRRGAEQAGSRPYVFFLTASPPQIGNAIKEKLELDGIGYDGISFKDQVTHLFRGRFDALREQIGYKLSQLLAGGLRLEEGARELLFGDDWESDPFVYSLYADIVAGRLPSSRVFDLLERAHVNEHYIERVVELLGVPRPRTQVDGIFVLRQRHTPDAELAGFRRRLNWFDNYFECALTLYFFHLLDLPAVLKIADGVGLSPHAVAGSFEAVIARGRVPRAALGRVRRALLKSGRSTLLPPASPARALGYGLRRLARPPHLAPKRAEPLPDYETLVEHWSHHGRKQKSRASVQSELVSDPGRTNGSGSVPAADADSATAGNDRTPGDEDTKDDDHG